MYMYVYVHIRTSEQRSLQRRFRCRACHAEERLLQTSPAKHCQPLGRDILEYLMTEEAAIDRCGLCVRVVRSIAKQFQEGSYLRLVDFCITQL